MLKNSNLVVFALYLLFLKLILNFIKFVNQVMYVCVCTQMD